MRVVIALGGNALAPRGARLDVAGQEQRVAAAAARLAPVAREHELVVTHGNGPQVGWLAQAGDARPLDALDAETEGLIGYWIERELAGRLPGGDVATLLTRVEVDPAVVQIGLNWRPFCRLCSTPDPGCAADRVCRLFCSLLLRGFTLALIVLCPLFAFRRIVQPRVSA